MRRGDTPPRRTQQRPLHSRDMAPHGWRRWRWWRRRRRWRRRRWRWRRRGRRRKRRRRWRRRRRPRRWRRHERAARLRSAARRENASRARARARHRSRSRCGLPRSRPMRDRGRRMHDPRQGRHVAPLRRRERERGDGRGGPGSQRPEPQIGGEDRARGERRQQEPEGESCAHRPHHRSSGRSDGGFWETDRRRQRGQALDGSGPGGRGSGALEREERALGGVEGLPGGEHVERALVEGPSADRTRRHARCLTAVPDGSSRNPPPRGRHGSSQPPSQRRARRPRS